MTFRQLGVPEDAENTRGRQKSGMNTQSETIVIVPLRLFGEHCIQLWVESYTKNPWTSDEDDGTCANNDVINYNFDRAFARCIRNE